MAWTKEQEQAIEKSGTNIIVSAGAGSGKTAVLTARTMRILNSNTHINELLILTFTKAAASEMKERIRKSIKKGISQNEKLKEDLELIDQAYITTFDSFALSVVKKYHYLLNISNEITITDASIIDMQKNKIIEETFDKYYQNPQLNFNKLITDFCVKDDNDLKKSILKIATKIDGLPNREEYLNTYLDNYFSLENIKKLLTEYLELLNEKKSEIFNLEQQLSCLIDSDYNNKIIEALSPLNNCKSINDYYNSVCLIKLPSSKAGSDEEIKEARAKLKEALDELKNIVITYKTEEEIKESLNIVKEYSEVIISIIKDYLISLHEYKKNNEIYDFQDIALLSIKVLKENEFVRQELKNTFKEIMIDEYQDTNDIQETFISMIENHNVYMVGDIKQSIYRFRNANPYIFKNKYDNYALGQNGLKIDLVKNFRSRKEVLENINLIFNLLMDNRIGGAEYHESHQMVYGNTSYIEEGNTSYNYDFEILEYTSPEDKSYTKEEIEIFTIAKDIKDKLEAKYQIFDKDTKELKDISYNDFVILIDRTSDFDLYKKIFEYLGIPLTLYKDDKLNNADDIYILKNILDYIIKISLNEYNQEFKYDYISIARSYLFSLSDQEIFNSFKEDNYTNNIVFQTFKELATNLNKKTITTLLEEIISRTNMYEKLIRVGNIDSSIVRLSKLFDIADNLSTLGYNIYTFRDYLKELLDTDYDMKYSLNNNSSNSVKIMTIHKSKGLEYHICYYSGLYKNFNISDLKERFLFDNKYGIITPYFKEGIHDTIIKYLTKYHYLEEEVSEKIRLFYVALTRAKEKMILITPQAEEEQSPLDSNHCLNLSIRKKYRSFSQMLDSIKYYISKYYKSINLDELNLSKNYLYNNRQLAKLNEKPSQEFKVSLVNITSSPLLTKEHFSKNLHELINQETAKNLQFGLKMHETLELIDFKNPDYNIIDNKFISSKIKKFLEEPLLSNLNDAIIYKEYEFIYNDENNEYHGIIDLMIEYEDKIDIIDYKLNNIKDDNYLKQLNGYKKYISSITSKPINLYLYSIISETLEKI